MITSPAGFSLKRWIPAPVFAAALLSAAMLAPAPASALQVNVPSYGLYDFSLTNSTNNPTYSDNSLLLSQQKWFGDEAIARAFATALGGQLLFPNPSSAGPFFAVSNGSPGTNTFNYVTFRSSSGVRPSSGLFNASNSVNFTFATATPVGVPGPLPVLGALAAFGYSRKLRQRIQAHRRRPEGSAGD